MKNAYAGQSMLELIFAIALFAMLSAAIGIYALGGFGGLQQSENFSEAELLATEGIEAVKQITDRAWNAALFSQSGVEISSNDWIFSGEGTQETIGDFTRTISFNDVCRDASHEIVVCPAGSIDPHTKEVNVSVSWTNAVGGINVVSDVAYITNWNSSYWTQTNWSGGPGQSTWSDASRYDFDDGNIDVSTSGIAKLTTSGGIAFEQFVPGGGETVTHTSRNDFNQGTLNNVEIIGNGPSASLFLEDSVRWASHVPTGESIATNMLQDIMFLNSSFGYAVGRNGSVIRWDGTKWVGVDVGTEEWLEAVYIQSTNDIWIVGRNGTIVRWNGVQWKIVQSAHTRTLNDVYMLGGNDGWIVSDQGGLQRWNGSVWIGISSPTTRNLLGLDFVDANNGWAVGDQGTILRWNGSSWSSFASPTTNNLHDVECFDANNCWAVGQQGIVLYYDGSSWSAQTTPATRELHSVSVVSLSFVVVAGGNGVGQGEIISWDGSNWNNDTPGTVNGINGVDMISTTNGQAVGGLPNESAIFKYNGLSWTEITSGLTNTHVLAMDIISSTDGWAVGRTGLIYDFDGTDWNESATPTNRNLNAVHFSSSSNGWAVGQQGTIIRYDGSSWSSQTSPTTNELYGVYALSSSDAWAVGAGGTILHWNGTVWSTATSPTASNLRSIFMVTGSDGWAVGAGGTILRWNGTSWSTVTSPTGNILRNVYLINASEGWAVGNSGTIIRWNGSTWSSVTSPVTTDLYDIDFISNSDGWASGLDGVMIHWDGTNWSSVSSPTSRDMFTVAMISSTDVWAMGEFSTIIHYMNFYDQSGTYTSSIINSGSISTHWDFIYWLEDTTNSNTDITIDTRTGNSPAPDGTWSSFMGAYTTPSGEAIVSPDGQYLQYRISFTTSDPEFSPELKEVTINFNNPTTENLNSVAMITDSVGYAVGNAGTIVDYDGSLWDTETSPSPVHLYGNDFFDATNGWAVGNSGVILERSNSGWSSEASPVSTPLRDVSVVDLSNVFAVGDGGVIVYGDGSAWSIQPTGITANLHGIHMLSATEGWVVGQGGVILQWNGSAWVSVSSPTATTLRDVFFVNSNDGWAMGDDGVIIHWDGSSWSNAYTPTTQQINDIYMTSSTDGWAVGNQGTILRYEGISWALFTSPTTSNLNSVSLSSSSDGWIVGDQGLFLHLIGIGEGGSFVTYGELTSSAFDTGRASAFQIVEWDEDLSACASCEIKLQLRAAPDSSGSPGTWSDWYGATGAGSYFEEAAGQIIPLDLNDNQWMQYRVEFMGDGNDSPILEEVRVNYK